MGGAHENVWLPEQLEVMLPNVTDYDMVFVSVQECIGNRMTNRCNALEMYLRNLGYENID